MVGAVERPPGGLNPDAGQRFRREGQRLLAHHLQLGAGGDLAEQVEAMELLEAIANDPAFYLEMDFQPGDVQFLNNARILHAREAYEDRDDLAERRHLLRLWLVAHHFSSVDEILQGGIPRQHPGTAEAT